MQLFRLPGQFRIHMEQYENDKREASRRYRQQLKETTKQMYALNNHIMNTQIKFKTVNNKITDIICSPSNNSNGYLDNLDSKSFIFLVKL